MPLAETLWRNADPDADRETLLGQCDHFARITWHRVPRLFCPRSHSRFAVSSRLGPASRPRYARAMYGRARLSSDVSEIKLVFSIPPDRPDAEHRAELERNANRPSPGGPL